MSRRWFAFRHPIGDGSKFFAGAHLVESQPQLPGMSTADTLRPCCGDRAALLVSTVHEPSGFLVACTKCLALSESSNG